uniref:Ig-like domain-containing protein n=1 Tax=Hucho hucho TaxID=62062 RepID=A0A4W5JWX3_9TELE
MHRYCLPSGSRENNIWLRWFSQRFWMARGVCCDIRLDQSPSQVKKPGDAVKLSCTISGFDMTDYYMHWIRQQPGKRLDKLSLKSRFSISKDDSNNIVIVEGQRSLTEDTAVYYCLWNNTVSCETYGVTTIKLTCRLFFSSHYSFSKFPTVSLLSAPIGTTQYLMCSIEDLAPNKVTVTGKQNDMQVEGLTHTVGKQPSGLYSASSLLKVTNTDWNNKVKYSCVVQHTEQTITKTISKTGLYIGEDCTIIYVMLTYRISII